jgi:DNA-directed RNA polymerase subunit RPC12/RpoP
MDKIPCFLCGSELDVRTDKNGKRYLICEPCGSQHFIRRKRGMERLAELGHYFYQQKAELAARMKTLLRVQARLQEIDTLKKEVQRLDLEAGIIFRDTEKLRARDAVQRRVDALLAELERTAEEMD